jgi:hypothetical protein
MLLQFDPFKELSKEFYKNISKCRLYRVATKPLTLPCTGVIEWMTRKVDHSNKILLNFEGKKVARYQPYKVQRVYHFKEPHIKITQEWLQNKAETVDYLSQMKDWWAEGNFLSKPLPFGWPTMKL